MGRSLHIPVQLGLICALVACDNGLVPTLSPTAPGAPLTPTQPTASTSDAELCDGIDNDGDGQVDEGLLVTWYEDADNDGYGSPSSTVEACEAPDGFVDIAGDCDDSEPGAWDLSLIHI